MFFNDATVFLYLFQDRKRSIYYKQSISLLYLRRKRFRNLVGIQYNLWPLNPFLSQQNLLLGAKPVAKITFYFLIRIYFSFLFRLFHFRYSLINISKSPSIILSTLPDSALVRWSFTIVYGCIT